MKRLFSTVLALVMLLLVPASLQAADKPDIVNYTAQFLDRALHVTLQWQSVNPVTLVRVSAGHEAKEIKVDEYDNRRVPGGYTGEVTVNVPVDATLYQRDVPFVLQLVDDLRLTSEVVTGKAPLPAQASPYGHHGQAQDSWGQDHLKPTPRSQGGSGDMIDKLVELKDRYDLAPSITEIKVNQVGPNNVTFTLKANDDKQLREINFKVFDTQGNLVQTQQATGLGRVWEGTSPVFRLSGGNYRVTTQAVDSAGNTSKEQSASFLIKGGSLADQPGTVIPPTTPVTTVVPTTPTVEQPVVTTPTTPTTPTTEQPAVTTPTTSTTPVTEQPVVTTPSTPTTPTTDPPVVTPPPPTTPVIGQPVVTTPTTPTTLTMICTAGHTNCSGRCVDTRTDAANCGACGKVCPQGQSCVNGACTVQTTQTIPVGELLQNGDFSRGGSNWTFETWYQQANPAGEVIFGQPRVTFKSTSGNSRVGIMQTIDKDISGCRTLMLKAVVRADQQTLTGTGYGGREAPISVFAGYQDANGVERTQNASLANPAEPQARQLFWHGFYYQEPAGLSTPARGSKVQQGQWYSYVVDLMNQNPRPKMLRFAGAEGAGWPTRSGALHQISLACNGDATPLPITGATAGQTTTTTTTTLGGMQPLQPPSAPVIYSNGNIAAVQNGPRKETTFSISGSYRVSWIYTYHYFNNGKQPGTISLRHSDGTVYGPFQAQGAVGQGNVPNAYWWVKPNVAIKPGSYTVVDSDPGTWSHNSGSNYAGFVELRGVLVQTAGTTTTTTSAASGMQPLQPPSDPVIYANGNIAGVQNSPRTATSFSIKSPYTVTWIQTYHYFNNGTPPGMITLKHSDGTTYGSFLAQGAVGQGNVPNAYWWTKPNITIKPGTYTVIDSNPTTWSHNSGSNYAGFVELRGVECGAGKAVCGQNCVDIMSSDINCGGCNKFCSYPNKCKNGKCLDPTSAAQEPTQGSYTTPPGSVGSCGVGEISCNGKCTITMFDSANCGACGKNCAAGQECNYGVCVTSGMRPLQPPSHQVIYSNGNIAGVQNGPRNSTTFSIAGTWQLSWIQTYHYFNGGKQPGRISLRHSDGTVYGPFQAQGAVGQGNVPNAYWWAKPNVAIKPGSYTVVDSDPATWSHNSGSNYAGFVELRGFAVVGGGQSSGSVLGPSSVIGVWDTSEGTLAFTQNGATVFGSYSQDNGKIEGTMNGNVLDGYWTEASSSQRCPTPRNGNYFWGKVRFVFSGNTFAGAWGYCTANPDHPWSGTKR